MIYLLRVNFVINKGDSVTVPQAQLRMTSDVLKAIKGKALIIQDQESSLFKVGNASWNSKSAEGQNTFEHTVVLSDLERLTGTVHTLTNTASSCNRNNSTLDDSSITNPICRWLPHRCSAPSLPCSKCDYYF